MSQKRNTPYSLRSQCKDHGSCSCHNSLDLPHRRLRRSKSNTSSHTSLSSTSSELDFSSSANTSLEASSADVQTSYQTSFRYSSIKTKNKCLVSSHSKVLEDSDYISDCSVKSDVKLRSILITHNSGERSSHRNGGVSSRSVRFDEDNRKVASKAIIITNTNTTPLSSLHDKELTQKDLRTQWNSNNMANSTSQSIYLRDSNVSSSSTFSQQLAIIPQQVMRFIRFVGYPLYWLLVQFLVLEKWFLRRKEGGSGSDDSGSSQENYYFSSGRVNSRMRGGGDSFLRSRAETEEYYSETDDDEVVTVARNRRNLINGNGRTTMTTNYNNTNGHYPKSSTPTSTNNQVHGLLQNSRTQYVSTTNNQQMSSVSRVGMVQDWGKRLMVYCKPREMLGISRANTNEAWIEEDEEDEGDDEVVAGTDWCSWIMGFCKILAKLLLLFLIVFFLLYFGPGLWETLKEKFTYKSYKDIRHKDTEIKTNNFAELEGLEELRARLSILEAELETIKANKELGFDEKSHPPQPQEFFPPIKEIDVEELKESILSSEDLNKMKLRIGSLEIDMKSTNEQHQKARENFERFERKLPPPVQQINVEVLKREILASHKLMVMSVERNVEKLESDLQTTKEEHETLNANFENYAKTTPSPVPSASAEIDVEGLKQIILSDVVKFCCEKDIESAINEALMKYDADKTALPDLALEPAGGSILSTRCTKSSQLRHSVVSFWGFKIWSPPNNPRTIIQPGVVPGECWAFEGSVGDVVIKLISPSIITGFTMEHIPKTVSPYGNIDSAPKRFQVLGLNSEEDVEFAHDYGTFTYEDNNKPMQYFLAETAASIPYPIVELKILSNHGNLHHTCLYRFRVHGQLALSGGSFTATVQAETDSDRTESSVEDN